MSIPNATIVSWIPKLWNSIWRTLPIQPKPSNGRRHCLPMSNVNLPAVIRKNTTRITKTILLDNVDDVRSTRATIALTHRRLSHHARPKPVFTTHRHHKPRKQFESTIKTTRRNPPKHENIPERWAFIRRPRSSTSEVPPIRNAKFSAEYVTNGSIASSRSLCLCLSSSIQHTVHRRKAKSKRSTVIITFWTIVNIERNMKISIGKPMVPSPRKVRSTVKRINIPHHPRTKVIDVFHSALRTQSFRHIQVLIRTKVDMSPMNGQHHVNHCCIVNRNMNESIPSDASSKLCLLVIQQWPILSLVFLLNQNSNVHSLSYCFFCATMSFVSFSLCALLFRASDTCPRQFCSDGF